MQARKRHRQGWLTSPLLVTAILVVGACQGASSPPEAGPPTLGPAVARLIEGYDPVAIARGLEPGRGCEGSQIESDIQDAYAHATWTLIGSREPGDRTIYFQLVDATEAVFVDLGATTGSGTGHSEPDVARMRSWNVNVAGVRGRVRIVSVDLDEGRLHILVSLDAVAI